LHTWRRDSLIYSGIRATVVVVVDPDEETVTSFRPGASPVMLGDKDELLDLDDVIPGFHCHLREIFGSAYTPMTQ